MHEANATAKVIHWQSENAVELPYAWDVRHPGQQGEAIFDVFFDGQSGAQEPWGLFIQRIGNAYEIWLNGELLQREGDLDHFNTGDRAMTPRYVTVPPDLIHEKNVLRIHIRTDIGRKGGLSPIVLGTQAEVFPEYRRAFFVRSTLSAFVSIFSLLVGSLAFVLWLTVPKIGHGGSLQRDPLYLQAAVAELVWSFAVGYMFFEEPLIAWPYWGVLTVGASAVWAVAMSFFCIEVANWQRHSILRWFKRWVVFLLALNPLMTFFALSLKLPILLTLMYAASGLSYLTFGLYFVHKSMRSAPSVQKVLATVVVINTLVGLRDLYIYRIHVSFSSIVWLRYSSILFGVSLVYVVLTRFRNAIKGERELAATLSSRIDERERELNSAFTRLEQLAREQERVAERTRVLRDMHDGVGAHISSAIRQLQLSATSPGEVLMTLRDALDQLKLTIDSLNQPPGDVTTLLANLRYRLAPRFSSMQLALHWDVDALPKIPYLDSAAMRQLQFILFEAMSNTLQHSGAHILNISAHVVGPKSIESEESKLQICIEDDGCGFDASAPNTRGLASMRERASAIGAHLELSSSSAGTQVRLTFLLPNQLAS